MALGEEIVRYVGLAGLADVERGWDALAVRAGSWPFLRPGWIGAWWRAFGNGELKLLCLHRGGELAAVLPLCERRSQLRSTSNWHTPVYGPVAADSEAARAVLVAALEEKPRRLDLAFLDPDAPGLAELRDPAKGYRLSERTLMRSPYISVDGDWDGYFASLSRNLRSSVRRCRKKLEKLGSVELEVADGRERLDELLEDAFEIEALGWKGEKGTAIGSTEQTHTFYKEVATWAAGAGILRLAFLRLDGRGVAVNFSIEDQRSHYLLKTGYDPELRPAGPGKVLLAEMIRRSFGLGQQTYEFLGAEAPYKRHWTERAHDRVRAQLFAPGVSGRIDGLIQTRGMAIARAARDRLSG